MSQHSCDSKGRAGVSRGGNLPQLWQRLPLCICSTSACHCNGRRSVCQSVSTGLLVTVHLLHCVRLRWE